MFFKSNNATEKFIADKLFVGKAATVCYALVHFWAEHKIFSFCFFYPLADTAFAIHFVMGGV